MKTLEARERFNAHNERKGLSKETRKWYSSFLTRYANTYDELPADPDLVEQFIASYQSSDYRRFGCFRALKAFYNYLNKRYEVANPMELIPKPRVKFKEATILTLDEIKTLLNHPGHTPEMRALLYLLTDSGMRIGEAAGITADDIKEDRIKISGKTGQRTVPLRPVVRDMLLSLGPGKLFIGNADNLSRKVTRAIKDAGPKGTAHTLRHSFCTHFRGDLISLKQITGHRTWQMVEHYKHSRLDDAIREHQEHSPLALIYGDNENGHKPPDAQNETPDIRPDSIQVTGKTDDISAILKAFPHKDGANHLPTAKFYYHATLYNAGQQLLHAVTQHIKRGNIQDYMFSRLHSIVLLSGEVDNEDTPEDVARAMLREAKKLWKMELAFLESFVADQYARALEYKRLAGETTAIEEVTVLDRDYYSLEISN